MYLLEAQVVQIVYPECYLRKLLGIQATPFILHHAIKYLYHPQIYSSLIANCLCSSHVFFRYLRASIGRPHQLQTFPQTAHRALAQSFGNSCSPIHKSSNSKKTPSYLSKASQIPRIKPARSLRPTNNDPAPTMSLLVSGERAKYIATSPSRPKKYVSLPLTAKQGSD